MANSHGNPCVQATKMAALSNATERRKFVEARAENGANRRKVTVIGQTGQQPDPVLVIEEMFVKTGSETSAIAQLQSDFQVIASGTALGGRLTRLVPSGQPAPGNNPPLGVAVATRRLKTAPNPLSAGVNHVVTLGGTDKGGVTPDNALNLGHGDTSNDGPLVVVVDSGIDAAASNRGDGWLDGVSASSHPQDVDALFARDKNGNVRPGILDLGAGHGTFVAGVIRQFAKKSNIKMIRALDPDGTCTEVELAEAILRAADLFKQTTDKRGILNLSLGFESVDQAEPLIVRTALDELPEHVIVVAAAGNAPTGIKLWPAAFQDVIAVGSHKGDNPPTPSDWSNKGGWVNASACGECVVSTFVTGTEVEAPVPPGKRALLYDPHPDHFGSVDPVAMWTGTSFAAPKVTAALANTWQDATLTKAQVRAQALQSPNKSATHGVLL